MTDTMTSCSTAILA